MPVNETAQYYCRDFYLYCPHRGKETDRWFNRRLLYTCLNTGCLSGSQCKWCYVLTGGKLKRLVPQRRNGIPKRSTVTVFRNVN